jgi:predicted metal-dependent hydrolase
VEPVPDELDLTPGEALDYAQRLLDEGRAFGAHEVLEAVWKAAPEQERELWRSLAQLAVGVTHLERGNPAGARALLDRAATGLAHYRPGVPYGIAVDRLAAEAEALVQALAPGHEPPPVPGLRLRG